MKYIDPNDLEVLARIFFPRHDHLLILAKDEPPPDVNRLPAGQIVLAMPEGCMPEEALYRQAAGLIGFGENSSLPGFTSRRFGVVKNPDGSIRWLYPEDCRRPVFLKLYNGSGWRGWLFKTAFRIGFVLDLKALLSAGTVLIFYQKKQPLDKVLAQMPDDDYAIFTGTAGENRKAVIAMTSKEQNGWFFKMPLTPIARSLVNREQAALQEIQTLSLKKIVVPLVQAVEGGVLLSDIRPLKFSNHTELLPIHLEALAELRSRSLQQLPLCSLPAWTDIRDSLAGLHENPALNDLPAGTVQRIRDNLYRLYDSFNPYIPVPTTLAHGDFTPWNMYAAGHKLHLYDWELSERLPVLYDAFHFIFQTGILIKRLPFSKIYGQVMALRTNPLAKGSLTGQPVDFNWLYRFYLLRNVSYYLEKYIRQEPLHEQAHWLVNTWAEALEKDKAVV